MRCLLVLLLLLATPAHAECLKTKALVHLLKEAEFRPVEYGRLDKIPYIVVMNRHGRQMIVLLPLKHVACVSPMVGV